MKSKAEYKEGPEARENFERMAKAVFQAQPKHKEPKHKEQKRRQPNKATARKASGKNGG